MSEDDDDEDDWFGGGFDLHEDGDDAEIFTVDDDAVSTYNNLDLSSIMTRIGTAAVAMEECNDDDPWSRWRDYLERTKLVEMQMGSMTLCRGSRGEELREAGAIIAILSTLKEQLSTFPTDPRQEVTQDESKLRLLVACFGAARDLACGSAGNREAFCHQVEMDGIEGAGMKLMALYLKRYHKVRWNEVDRLHLKLLTAVIGTMRNVTHSSPENCSQLHHHGVSEMLMWRLKYGNSSRHDGSAVSLPDSSDPCREGAFRSAATLINMAEKCRDCAELYGRDASLLRLLVESWGGNQKALPVLHLGLAAILKSAKEQDPENFDAYGFEKTLANEEHRKGAAQQREEERKRNLLLANQKGTSD